MRPQGVPKVSPVTLEPQELSPALLQPQVTMVAILGEVLATLPRLDEMMLLPVSALLLYSDLEEFTNELRDSLYCVNDTWRCHIASYNDEDPVTSLSRAMAASKSTPATTWDDVTMAAITWQRSVSVLVNSRAELARKARKLCNACRDLATEAADRAVTATTRARELQDEAVRHWTAWENMVGLGQALRREEGAEVVAGHEVRVRRLARVAASKVRRATMERRRVEKALGQLERLVDACTEATAFPRELQRLLWDIEAALKGTNAASPDIPEDKVAKVAVAERLWEASNRLVKDHMEETLRDIIDFYFTGGPARPSACGVAERCQRAIEDIPKLLQPPECPQSVPKVSPVTMEPQEVQQGRVEGDRDNTRRDTVAGRGEQRGQEADKGMEGQRGPLGDTGPLQEAVSATLIAPLSPPQLQVLVAVVATLNEVVATVTGPHRDKFLYMFPDSRHEDLKSFTRSLCAILNHGGSGSLGHSGVPSLTRALATFGATPGTTWANVRAAARAWRELVARVVDSWDWLAREATKLHEKVVTDQKLMVVLNKEEMAREMAPHDAQVVAATNEAMGEAGVAIRRGHWAEVALGLLDHLVATCDKATLFNWNMEWQLRDIEAILKGTNQVSPDVFQVLVAKVAKFEWLWEASTHLAKEHLLGALGAIDNILLSPCGDHGGPGGPSSRAVAEQCQKAIEDIPRLLQESFT